MLRIAVTLIAAALSTAASAQDTITIPAEVPYVEGSGVDTNIEAECKLTKRVADDVSAALAKAGYEAKRSEKPGKKGDVLDLKIASAVSGGNAFIGHRKHMTVTGKLLRDGKPVGSFTATRHSGGGFGAGFKGSCAVLNGCSAAIGR